MQSLVCAHSRVIGGRLGISGADTGLAERRRDAWPEGELDPITEAPGAKKKNPR